MIENATIARPYAVAAFALAQERNELGAWSEALEFLAAVVAYPDMRRVISDPRIASARLSELVLAIGGERYAALVRNFVKLLVENGRLLLAPDIARLYEAKKAEAQRSVDVEVTSAFALKPEETDKIAQAVTQRLGKTVKLSTRVDRQLIGGAVVRVGDLVIDASLRGRLNQLGHAFG
ncbi:MAG: F0F1 ATP synthase subunit delta [Gammaproteobacteria bacterium]